MATSSGKSTSGSGKSSSSSSSASGKSPGAKDTATATEPAPPEATGPVVTENVLTTENKHLLTATRHDGGLTMRTNAASPEQFEQAIGGYGDLEVTNFQRTDDDRPGMYEVTLDGDPDALDSFAEERGITPS